MRREGSYPSGVISYLIVDHKSKDTHHVSTAVVELDGTLGELGLVIKVVPAEVDVSIMGSPMCLLPVPGISCIKAHSNVPMKAII